MTPQDPCLAKLPALRVLLLPGLDNSGPANWQSRWEAIHGDARVHQRDWSLPARDGWMKRLDEAIADIEKRESSPLIALVAHSLGCHLVASWATQSPRTTHVRAALLVAPPDIERAEAPDVLHSFRPVVRNILPFPTTVAISEDDPYCSPARAHAMAADWGARALDIGARGHVNEQSAMGDWPEGRRTLAALL